LAKDAKEGVEVAGKDGGRWRKSEAQYEEKRKRRVCQAMRMRSKGGRMGLKRNKR